MTDPYPTVAGGADRLPARAATLARHVPQRVRERPFWIIQAGVLAVTASHLLTERWAGEFVNAVHPALHHVPVILYLAPIAYASLRYGLEGAFLTGVWCAVLTLPNIVVFHPQNLEWLAELVYVGMVIAAGVTMAVPVERERRQRRLAEATSRRLALLHDIATLTLTADLHRTLHDALASLVTVLDLDEACVAAADRDNPAALAPLARHPVRSSGADPFARCLEHLQPPPDAGTVQVLDHDILAVPFDIDLPDPSPAGRVSGVLAVRPATGPPLTSEDHRLLVAVSNQLAVALANARLKELERDRVRSYARLVTWAQEEERKRIARELHDEAAQNLVAIRRTLDTLSMEYAGQSAPDALDRLHVLTGRTLSDLRRFSRDLRPPVLDDLGLASALEALIDDLRRRSDLGLDFTIEGAPRRLAADTELILFRIGQAALHNVERHANASQAAVSLDFQTNQIRLAVTDNGTGFELPDDIGTLAAEGKLGLLGMHERAQLAGARLVISSRPGGGTCVKVEVAA